MQNYNNNLISRRLSSIFMIVIFFPFLLAGCAPDKEKAKSEIVKTEKEFAEMAEKKGIAEAFTFYIADSGVINAGDKILKGKMAIRSYYSNPKYQNAHLKWAPDFVDVSSSGDLGYTYGKYVFSLPDSTGKMKEVSGIFHTVWKRQPDGNWKFVWD